MAESKLRGNYEFEVIEKHCTNAKGQDIFGVLYKPEREGKMPIILLSPELGNIQSDEVMYNEFFASLGIAVYSFDFCGGSSRTRSDSHIHDMSVMTEVADLEAILAEVKTWDFVDNDKIVLMGLSQGGLVTILTAAKHNDEIAACMLCYPGLSIVDEITSPYKTFEDIPEEIDVHGWYMAGRQYAADIWGLDTFGELAKYKKPTLLLHGTADDVIPVSYAEKAARCDNIEYHPIDGAGHGFLENHFDVVIKHMVEFLDKEGYI